MNPRMLEEALRGVATSGCEGDDEHIECGDVCEGHEPCQCHPHVAARALAEYRAQPPRRDDAALVEVVATMAWVNFGSGGRAWDTCEPLARKAFRRDAVAILDAIDAYERGGR